MDTSLNTSNPAKQWSDALNQLGVSILLLGTATASFYLIDRPGLVCSWLFAFGVSFVLSVDGAYENSRLKEMEHLENKVCKQPDQVTQKEASRWRRLRIIWNKTKKAESGGAAYLFLMAYFIWLGHFLTALFLALKGLS